MQPAEPNLLSVVLEKHPFEVRALLTEMPLAHDILLHVYSVGFPLGSLVAMSVEGA